MLVVDVRHLKLAEWLHVFPCRAASLPAAHDLLALLPASHDLLAFLPAAYDLLPAAHDSLTTACRSLHPWIQLASL